MPGLTAKLKERMAALADSEQASADKYLLPDDSPEKLLVWLEDHRIRGKKRMPDLQMKMNLAYTLGHQWIVWDRDRRQFRRPQWRPNDPNAPIRVTINKIGGIVERTIARLLKDAPDPECRPASDDEREVGAARVGTRILEHEMEREHWDVKMVDLYFWVTVMGWSYMHPHWNPNAGKLLGTMQIEAVDGKKVDAPAKPVHAGEVNCEVVPAFELSVDPNAMKMDRALWCVRTVNLTKEACWEKFGVVPPSDLPGKTLVDEVYALTDKAREDRPYVETVAIHQMWIRPGSRICPAGAVITWGGTTILDQKPFPYDHGKLPFIQFDLLPGLGMREGRTWLNDLIPIQADYNDARSREASIRRFMVPKLLYSTGSVDMQKMSSRFEGVPYVPTGAKPEFLMPDGRWQAQHETVMNRAQGELAERAGQADVSSGQAPASMPAASVMSLQEADDTKLSISIKQMSKGIAQVGWQWLMLCKQFWDEPRIIRTWSQEGDLEAKEFSGSDLSEQLDIHVDAESSLPRSKSARMQLLMQLAEMPGMFNDPRDFLKQLDMPGITPLLASMSIDNKQAERENSSIFDGNQCEVHQWDNHPIHIQEHNDFRKTEMFERILDAAAKGDPMAIKVKAHMETHVQAHQEQIQVAQQGQKGGLPDKMIETIDYKDAPPDIQRQMEAAAGMQPSQDSPPPGGPVQMGVPDGTGAPGAQVNAPSSLSEAMIRQGAAIGGPGEQGAVPGISADVQAARTGR